MSQNGSSNEQFWTYFYGPNLGYIEEQYDLYKEDPEAVEPSLKKMFDQHGGPEKLEQSQEPAVQSQHSQPSLASIKKLSSAIQLVEAIRRFGHLEANIYPVGRDEREINLVKPETYDLTEDDLRQIPADWLWERAPKGVNDGYEAIQKLKKIYSGTITFEYDHLNNNEERKWLLDYIESGQYDTAYSEENQKNLLKRLAQVEAFEDFLKKTFVGQKRFSIEGLESMIPMLDRLVKHSIEDRVEHIMMGMAHRGRLSVLAHVLGKPFDRIFSEFHHSPDKELIPSEGSKGINYGWTGDVRYHYGATKDIQEGKDTPTRITLANNPSHLEFVNPVIEGFARAGQDDRSQRGYPEQDVNQALPVIIHGDAAFMGEGIVAETLNFKDLPAYQTGGTVHIIANNLLGYTTVQEDSRSTRYASDLAKGFEIPIVHVNEDDPAAAVAAVKMAFDYRQTFHKDFLIDLVGYRRYGHNEMDEPRATQPLLYQTIDKHPSTAAILAEQLYKQNVIQDDELAQYKEQTESHLRDIYENMKENNFEEPYTKSMPKALASGLAQFDTAVPFDILKRLNHDLQKRPEGFTAFHKVERMYQQRQRALDGGEAVDWGTGEALAYASILREGIPIRLTGQDTERGTFAHRHLVLHDSETGETYCPMHGLRDAEASFDIQNSPLSEASVLGFEYGYSVQAPNALVIWEAQFGDFVNAAQVIIDQFISAARAKWADKSNMVMLLPHGFEGQGPEHSSARLERFLQLAAENNWIVANVTSSAQYFHLIRRQAALRGQAEARPLILMSPKSLMRQSYAASRPEVFSEGQFEPLRLQPGLSVNKQTATRLLIGSGKIMVDIEKRIENMEETFNWLHAVRLEQIYPFPKKELKKVMDELPNADEIVWVQEEPRNMGSWEFVDDYLEELLREGQSLKYIGRPHRAAPAVGEPNIDKAQLRHIINRAITPSKGGSASD